MWRICFIIHLVQLVHGDLFVCRNYSKKCAKCWRKWTREANGRGREAKGPHAMSAGPTMAPPDVQSGLATSPICGSDSPSPLKRWSNVGLHRWSWWSGLGSMGPLSWTWSPPTNLGTTLPAKSSHVLPSKPPLGANQGPTIERQWNQGPTDAPTMPPGAQVTSTALLDVYKYPPL